MVSGTRLMWLALTLAAALIALANARGIHRTYPHHKCDALPVVEHGSQSFYRANKKWPLELCRVHFVCDPGHKMIGMPDVFCYLGKWSGKPPKCEAVRCRNLTEPVNGTFFFIGDVPPNMMHSVAYFTCQKDYEIKGDDYMLACLPDGTWSLPEPECMPIDCQSRVEYDDIRITFPRYQMVEDWAKFTSPFPDLRELTMCWWMNIFRNTSFEQDEIYPFSYATSDTSANTMYVMVNAEEGILRFGYQDIGYPFDGQNFEEERHYCVVASKTNISLYTNAQWQDTIDLSTGLGGSIKGGGLLMIGQEQDKLGGGFVKDQSFSGSVTNLIIYPTVLSEEEIEGITRNCDYPEDWALRFQLANLQWNRHWSSEVDVDTPDTCPVA